jgi:hypothetical protein
MNNPNAIICVWCSQIVGQAFDYTKTQFCSNCNDYKGLTTVREFQEMWS